MQITRPTFVVNKKQCVQNIAKIYSKTFAHQLIFRPHFKTHQSQEVGKWFQDFGVECITVSSVEMAVFFAQNGWKDITIAFPFNILEINAVNSINAEVQINLLVDSYETALFLTNNLTKKVGIFIEIDLFYGRSGILPSEITQISEIASLISESQIADFKGFLIHAGNTYTAETKAEVLAIHAKNLQYIKALKLEFQQKYKDIIVSYGDTPTASLANDFEGIDELRPGNFVYYDLMQQKIGSCFRTEIACSVLAPVVGIERELGEIVLHSGAVHLSKDYILSPDGAKNFGEVYFVANDYKTIYYNSKAIIYSVSQEHALAKCDAEFAKKVKIGDLLAILPIHSCLTANLMKNNQIILA